MTRILKFTFFFYHRWIEELASRGFPRKKKDILNSVQKFLTENPRPNLFVNNRPGDCWLKAFLKRNPSITQRTSESVSAASACVAEKDIRKWFTEIKNYLDSKNITMEDPSRVYNGDETGFQICPNTGKVFAAKGAKNVYSVEKGSPKENITVMFSFSASGVTCPPMIVYPYKRVPEKISMTVNPDWGIGRSDNGWMTADTFYEYIKNVFHPFLVERGATFPIVLFLDGHKSHLTYELSILCSELNIEVIALYPNATRILQPCDVAVFRPIKMGWKKAVREFNEQNPGEIVNKVSFAPLLENVVNNIELASDDENEVYADDEDNDSEVDAVEVDERDTDTEQDGVSDDSSDETEISDDYMYTGIPMYTGKDGQTKWSKMLPPSSRTKSHNLVLRIPGPVKAVKSAKTILQCFSTFIDDTMIDIIVICTNIKIEEIKRNFQRERDARETDSCEIKAFIGILYMAGTMKSGRQNILDLWATDGTGCEHVYLTMSYNRFRFICRCIRFDNIHDRHEPCPIRDIFEKFVDQCKSAFIPSAYLTVDEQLIAFRGRCSFRQYLPSKPAKYGIKLFALVDVNSMSTINLEIYAGK
nr:unnamed protein product [Callosobruchus chinensis]